MNIHHRAADKVTCSVQHVGEGRLSIETDGRFYTSAVSVHVQSIHSIDELRNLDNVKLGTRLWFNNGDYLDVVAKPPRVRKAMDAARKELRLALAQRLLGAKQP